MSKPLPPVRPVEKLPLTYHLTVVKDPARESGWWSVVLTETQGDQVRRRRVLEPAEPSVDLALDALNRAATRVWYFGEGEQLVEP